jgi:hypothetical protein
MDLRPFKTHAAGLAFLALLVAGVVAFIFSGAYRASTFEHLVRHKDALVALAGMFPRYLLYVYAGTQWGICRTWTISFSPP